MVFMHYSSAFNPPFCFHDGTECPLVIASRKRLVTKPDKIKMVDEMKEKFDRGRNGKFDIWTFFFGHFWTIISYGKRETYIGS